MDLPGAGPEAPGARARRAGHPPLDRALRGTRGRVLQLLAAAEIVLGLLILVRPASRWPLGATLLVLPGLLVAALVAAPATFLAPFNPPTLILAMSALALIGWLASRDVVSARRCLRRPPGGVA